MHHDTIFFVTENCAKSCKKIFERGLTGLQMFDIIKSRAEQSRAEQSRAEQSRAEQSRAG